MALKITASPYYFKIGNKVINKITDDFNPPRYWFRVKITAKRKLHRSVRGVISKLWWANHRTVKEFDPLSFLWINEPLQKDQGAGHVSRDYYSPDIAPGRHEIAGLVHAKLPMKPLAPGEVLPPDNIPDEQLPEVEFNQSENEPRHVMKRRFFPYGVYYAEVTATDDLGHKTRKIFKVWAYRDPAKCKIRSSRFHERSLLNAKSLLPPL